MTVMELWPAESIWEQLSPLLPGFTVEVLPEIDSSNTELMRRARAGQTEPTLLVAERQSAGRGRLGRTWHSAPGDSLTFSLSLPYAPQQWSGLSLAVGLSLAEALHPDIGLKWPNDLWLQGRKLGGILIEAATSAERSQLVVGVGLNIRPRPADGLSTPPAALTELWPQASAGQALAAGPDRGVAREDTKLLGRSPSGSAVCRGTHFSEPSSARCAHSLKDSSP